MSRAPVESVGAGSSDHEPPAAALGARAVDRPNAVAIGKAVVCCLLVAGADVLLRPLGPARLAIDAAAYASLLFALGVVKAEDAKQGIVLLRGLRSRGA